MFRRYRVFIALVAVLVVLTATVTVFAQSGSSPSTVVSDAILPTATQTPDFSSAVVSNDDAEPPAATVTPRPTITQTPEIPEAPPTSTPRERDEVIPQLTPFTPRVPEVSEIPEQRVEAPLQLQIPAIGVDAKIEWVGLDEMGNMGVPSTYRSVAWFEKGPRPGMTGNAVIAGHLDSQTGPAVFYRLGDLQPGDEILVTAHDGEQLRFVVDGMESFNSETAPVDEIFGLSSGQHLNLITCEGVFDPASGQYDKRLVVYSTLVTS